MRYYTKSNLYKASNVIFDPENVKAYSYDWWLFVSIIDNQVIFNDYLYSNTTRRHQSKVRNLMQDLGIEINRIVKVKEGLQNIKTLQDLNKAENLTLDMIKAKSETKRVERNLKARMRRQAALEATHVQD